MPLACCSFGELRQLPTVLYFPVSLYAHLRLPG